MLDKQLIYEVEENNPSVFQKALSNEIKNSLKPALEIVKLGNEYLAFMI